MTKKKLIIIFKKLKAEDDKRNTQLMTKIAASYSGWLITDKLLQLWNADPFKVFHHNSWLFRLLLL